MESPGRLANGSEKRTQLDERRGFTSDLAGRMILISDREEGNSHGKSGASGASSDSEASLPQGLVRVVLFMLPARSQRWGL